LPTAKELEGSGFEPADYALPPVQVWPDNWPVFMLFCDLRTQWRVAMGGATGLDYTAVLAVMDLHGITADKRRDTLADIQAMEDAALAAMAVTYT